jgi:hypothetical protein
MDNANLFGPARIGIPVTAKVAPMAASGAYLRIFWLPLAANRDSRPNSAARLAAIGSQKRHRPAMRLLAGANWQPTVTPGHRANARLAAAGGGAMARAALPQTGDNRRYEQPWPRHHPRSRGRSRQGALRRELRRRAPMAIPAQPDRVLSLGERLRIGRKQNWTEGQQPQGS